MRLVNQTKNMQIITSILCILLLLPIRHVISHCSESEWMCDNQVSCVGDDEKCDGQKDCPDGSDEIAVNCFDATTCPEFSFRCSYGACISGRRKCNGIPDCADKSDELFCPGNTAVTNLQGSCRSNYQMQCLSSKECIDISDTCDGQVDCTDGSDETIELCGRAQCPTGFRCAYGACVSGYARCNGTVECQDGSDEAWALCGYTRKLPKTSEENLIPGLYLNSHTEEGRPCKIPEGLSRLVITLRRSEEPLTPGTLVDDEESIRAKCKKNKEDGVDLYCSQGVFIGEFPTCRVFCDISKLQGISTNSICNLNGTNYYPICTHPVLVNTKITVYCSAGYSRSFLQELRCRDDGEFSEKRIPCVQRCGQLTPGLHPLTKNGFTTTPSHAPWHVAIYGNDQGVHKHICGGSIISPRLIISAAHCFWNRTIPNSPDLYRIIAGKLTSKYAADQSEGFIQNIEVEKIHYSRQYNDQNKPTNLFYADIAILKLKAPLLYNENVSSICMSYPEGDSNDYVGSQLLGTITGYGRSGNLEQLNMVTVNHGECRSLTGGKTLAGDKFCLRNNNLNSTLCQGDSGGGFVTVFNNAYHLLGIISYSPGINSGCASADFVGVSNVRYIRTDLLRILEEEMKSDLELF